MSPFRLMAVAGVLAFAIACDDSKTEVSGGDVLTDSTYRAVDYAVTSDQYRNWLRAQSALDSIDPGHPIQLDPRRATGDDIDRVVDSLENRPQVLTAIEGAGMNVKDFVLTTLALAQSWDAVNRPESRLTGVPVANVDLIRTNPAGTGLSTRPRTRVLDDGDSDSDSDSDGGKKKKKKHKGKG